MEKKKYYVELGSGEISQVKYQNNDSFTIYATDDEIAILRAKLSNMHDASQRGFWRAHVPIMPYHNDKPNDSYDSGMVEVYQMIHELGDETTKSHINSIGVLDDNHI